MRVPILSLYAGSGCGKKLGLCMFWFGRARREFSCLFFSHFFSCAAVFFSCEADAMWQCERVSETEQEDVFLETPPREVESDVLFENDGPNQ